LHREPLDSSWKEKAKKEIKGKDPDEVLKVQNEISSCA
jgi:hypothetical protein